MERRNLFLFIYIFQWKEDFYLHFSIERENISYLLTLSCRLETISFFFIFRWIELLSHKNFLFLFADK